MFIDTLEFTIPVDLCGLFSTLQQSPGTSEMEFPASVNSYGTTQDASILVALRSNKITFKVDGVSSNASIISKSECKTLKLSVFDVDRSLLQQHENDNSMLIQNENHLLRSNKRTYDSVSLPVSPVKSSRTSYSDSPRPRSPPHRRSQPRASPRPTENSQSKSQSDSHLNVKQEPEDPDLIEIEPDPEPDNDVVPKTESESPYMQIDYTSNVPHTQTNRSHQSPSSSYQQNIPEYAEPGPSRGGHGDQGADEFLVYQDDNDYEDNDNSADYSNDDLSGSASLDQFTSSGHGQYARSGFNPGLTLPNIDISCEVLGGQIKNYTCGLCSKQFTTSVGLRYHHRSIHDKLELYCICGRTYKHRRTLVRHWQTCSEYQLSKNK